MPMKSRPSSKGVNFLRSQSRAATRKCRKSCAPNQAASLAWHQGRQRRNESLLICEQQATFGSPVVHLDLSLSPAELFKKLTSAARNDSSAEPPQRTLRKGARREWFAGNLRAPANLDHSRPHHRTHAGTPIRHEFRLH